SILIRGLFIDSTVVILTYYVFFFFQAEDGIRDRNVTGVQTCALPIWLAAPGREQRTLGCDADRPYLRFGQARGSQPGHLDGERSIHCPIERKDADGRFAAGRGERPNRIRGLAGKATPVGGAILRPDEGRFQD